MSDLSGLKRLAAYYLRHHVRDFDGLEEEFIDEAANEIQDRMPTADIEKIRPFMVAGNVEEWIPLGQAIDAALNPSPDAVWTKYGTVELERQRDGSYSAELDGRKLGDLTELPTGLIAVARYKNFGEVHLADTLREACRQLATLDHLNGTNWS